MTAWHVLYKKPTELAEFIMKNGGVNNMEINVLKKIGDLQPFSMREWVFKIRQKQFPPRWGVFPL